MEKRDELWPHGPCFYYDTALFPPGTDSFCLAYFARPSRGDTVCDLGSGIGLLGTLLLARQESLFIENVELSAPAAALARKTFAENGWADRAAFHEGDLRDVSVLPKAGSVDYVISNPPYFPAGSGESAKGEARQIAREETSCTLDDVCAAAQTSSSVCCAMAGASPSFTAPSASPTCSAPCGVTASSPSACAFSQNRRTPRPRSSSSRESAAAKAALSSSRRSSPTARSGTPCTSENEKSRPFQAAQQLYYTKAQDKPQAFSADFRIISPAHKISLASLSIPPLDFCAHSCYSLSTERVRPMYK